MARGRPQSRQNFQHPASQPGINWARGMDNAGSPTTDLG